MFSGLKIDYHLKTITETNDPKEVLKFLTVYENTIVKNQKYISILVLEIKKFCGNLEVNKKCLELILRYIDINSSVKSSAESSISFLCKEGAITQFIMNMVGGSFLVETSFLSSVFDLINSVAKFGPVWVEMLSSGITKSLIIKNVVTVMMIHKKEREICDKGICLLLSVFECSKDLSDNSNSFISAGGIPLLLYHIHNFNQVKVDPKKVLKLLSILDLTKENVRGQELNIKNVVSKLFDDIGEYVKGRDIGMPVQTYVDKEIILYAFTFLSKASSECLVIRNSIIEKGYLMIVMDELSTSRTDEEILQSGSKILLSLTSLDTDVKKDVMGAIFGKLCQITASLDVPQNVYIHFFDIIHFLAKDYEDLSREAIDSNVIKKIIDVMKAAPENEKLQISGTKAVVAVLMRSSSDIATISLENVKPLIDALKMFSKSEYGIKYGILLFDALNVIPLEESNKNVMMDVLKCGVEYYPDMDGLFRGRYQEFERLYNNVTVKTVITNEIEIFTKSLNVFSRDPVIVYSCLTILTNILYKVPAYDKFNQHDGLKCVLNVMGKYRESTEILKVSCRLFAKISSCQEFATSPYNEECVGKLVDSMANNLECEEIQRFGAQALVNYADRGFCKNVIGKENVLSAMDNVFKNYSEDPEIRALYCMYLSKITCSESKTKVVELKCHENLLRMLGEENPKLKAYCFCGLCNLVALFGMVDIDSVEDLGISKIFEYIEGNKKQTDIVKSGLGIILKILEFKPSAQDKIEKNGLVEFIFPFSIEHADDSGILKVSKDIFSQLKFVQGKDDVNFFIMQRVEELLREPEQIDAILEECLVLLSKLAALNEFIESTLMEKAIAKISNIVRGNIDFKSTKGDDSYNSLLKHCFEALTAILNEGNEKVNIKIYSDVVCYVPAKNFRCQSISEYLFSFLLALEKSTPKERPDLYGKFGKYIFYAVNERGIPAKAKELGYELICDLLACSPEKPPDKGCFLAALGFLCENLENTELFNKISGLLNLVSISTKGCKVLTDIVISMLSNRDDPNSQIEGCKKVLERVTNESKHDILSCGVLETFFIVLMIHRDNNGVISETCEVLRKILKLEYDKIIARFACLNFDVLLVSLLKVNSVYKEAFYNILWLIFIMEKWIEVDPEKIKERTPQEFLLDPTILEFEKNIESKKPHKYSSVITSNNIH